MKENIVSTDTPVFGIKMSPEYALLINQPEYEAIIEIITGYFEKSDKRLEKFQDGRFFVKEKKDGIETLYEYSLYSVIRRVAIFQRKEWKKVINDFLDSRINMPAYRFFSKDYEHAKGKLKLLVKPLSFAPREMEGKMVGKTYFPGTFSSLVLHHERQFRFLTTDDVKEWGVPHEELVAEALHNLSKEHIEVGTHSCKEGRKIFCLMSNEYSAASMMDIGKRFPQMVGKQGTIFSIPSNGVVFALPMNEQKDMESSFRALLSVTVHAYNHEPSPVVFDLFHDHDGQVDSMLEVLKKEFPDMYERIKWK